MRGVQRPSSYLNRCCTLAAWFSRGTCAQAHGVNHLRMFSERKPGLSRCVCGANEKTGSHLLVLRVDECGLTHIFWLGGGCFWEHCRAGGRHHFSLGATTDAGSQHARRRRRAPRRGFCLSLVVRFAVLLSVVLIFIVSFGAGKTCLFVARPFGWCSHCVYGD